MGHQDFQGSMDNMVEMDMMEKKGIQAPQGTMKMQYLGIQDLQGPQDPQAEWAPWGLRDKGFLVYQGREDSQELRDGRASRALLA